MFKVYIYVMPKDDVLDPQGAVVSKALQRMGFSEFQELRVGKCIELQVNTKDKKEATAIAEKMARGLLANLMTEKFHVEVMDQK